MSPFSRSAALAGLICAPFIFNFAAARADTLFLKNGRSITGIIAKENDREIDLEVGCGTVKFSKDQIENVARSSSADIQLIKQKWAQDKEAQESRARELREKEARAPKPVDMLSQSGHLSVEALLNKKVKVRLILDTGATVMVLSVKTAGQLGAAKPQQGPEQTECMMADGRKVNAARVILDSVSVLGNEVRNVEAAVLPDQEINFADCDGLLGMSFLKNFNFQIDHKNKKLILERLP